VHSWRTTAVLVSQPGLETAEPKIVVRTAGKAADSCRPRVDVEMRQHRSHPAWHSQWGWLQGSPQSLYSCVALAGSAPGLLSSVSCTLHREHTRTSSSVKTSRLLMTLHLRATHTCHTGLHSVTCHLTQVTTPRLNPSQRPVLDLSTPEGWKAELY